MDPSLSNSTLMDLLNVTEDSSPYVHHLASLACLTSVWSDLLRSWSLWHRCCSSPFSRSRHNPSLALSRFIGVELHGEKTPVTFSRSIGVELDSEGSIKSTYNEHYKFEFRRALALVQIWNVRIRLNFWYMATRTYMYVHTYVSKPPCTRVLQCSPGSLRLTPTTI